MSINDIKIKQTDIHDLMNDNSDIRFSKGELDVLFYLTFYKSYLQLASCLYILKTAKKNRKIGIQ